MSMTRFALTVFLVTVLSTGNVAAQDPQPAHLTRFLRVMGGIPGDLVLGVEADVARWQDVSVVATLQRWSFGDLYTCQIFNTDGLGARRTISGEPACPPDGWGVAAGLRANPYSRHRVSPFIQGELGVYRYDGEGVLTSLASGRIGLILVLVPPVSIEAGLKIQRMSGYEWRGATYAPWWVGAWQLGVGIPFGWGLP